MKTSLSHLPEGKQNEIRRIAEIIREVAKGKFVEYRYFTQRALNTNILVIATFLSLQRTNPKNLTE
jgi:hypothetical protein